MEARRKYWVPLMTYLSLLRGLVIFFWGGGEGIDWTWMRTVFRVPADVLATKIPWSISWEAFSFVIG